MRSSRVLLISHLLSTIFTFPLLQSDPADDLHVRNLDGASEKLIVLDRRAQSDNTILVRHFDDDPHTREALAKALVHRRTSSNKALTKRAVDPKEATGTSLALLWEGNNWKEQTARQKAQASDPDRDNTMLYNHAKGCVVNEQRDFGGEKLLKDEIRRQCKDLHENGHKEAANMLRMAHKGYSRAWGRNHAFMKALARQQTGKGATTSSRPFPQLERPDHPPWRG